MELIVAVCRYALPVLTFIILIKCFMTLLIGHPVNENYAYIEDLMTGEKIALNTWETSIGKSKTCDIMLDYDVISRFHAVICRRVDGWYIFDTLSKNGTYIRNSSREKPDKVENSGRMIESGNIICFSNKEYRFYITNDPVMRIGKKMKGKTQKQEPVNYSAPFRPQEVIYSPVAEQAKTRQAALISRNSGKIYLLAEDAVTVGSSKSCDLRIANPTVSRIHAVLMRNNNNWYITDKNSTNGTTVNGVKLTGTRMLLKNDIIAISNEYFIFNNDYR